MSARRRHQATAAQPPPPVFFNLASMCTSHHEAAKIGRGSSRTHQPMCSTAIDARARVAKCSYMDHEKPRTSLSTSVAAGLERNYDTLLGRPSVRSSIAHVRRAVKPILPVCLSGEKRRRVFDTHVSQKGPGGYGQSSYIV